MKISNPKDKIITTIAIVVIIAVMYIFKLPCPFVGLLHIQCAGCGMTRAYLSLLHFDIKQAFMFNPMFWSVPILYVLYLFDGKIFKAKWANNLLSIPIYTGFMVLWIFRLITN
jgi:hypothetical protein